jgi:hypothetical protein
MSDITSAAATDAATPRAIRRSYLGIGSCCLFAIAAGCVVTLIASNWGAQYKLAGFEAIIVVPGALLLNFAGTVMGFFGTRRPAENRLSGVGFALNLIPLSLGLFAIAAGVAVEIGRSH